MDEEVRMLLKRLGLAFLVAIIFVIPTAIFVYNNLKKKENKSLLIYTFSTLIQAHSSFKFSRVSKLSSSINFSPNTSPIT